MPRINFVRKLNSYFKTISSIKNSLTQKIPGDAEQECVKAIDTDNILTVKTLEELDWHLDAIDQDYSSDDKLRYDLARIRLSMPETFNIAGADPYSRDYIKRVKALVDELRGSSYSSSDEGLKLNIEHELRWGFPYGTQSFATVGGYLIAYGYLIRAMALPPGASILEMGCGTGSLTIHMARMGYQLTCVDINETQLKLISRATMSLPGRVDTVCVDMDSFEADSCYDAVIFFESLHHSLEHAALLERAKKWLVPGGKLVLGAEPIVSGDDSIMPYAWGPRLDGESLRAIRKLGWMELGFTETYLYGLLDYQGWNYIRMHSDESQWSNLVLAQLLVDD